MPSFGVRITMMIAVRALTLIWNGNRDNDVSLEEDEGFFNVYVKKVTSPSVDSSGLYACHYR